LITAGDAQIGRFAYFRQMLTNLIVAGMALVGFVPLASFLYKKRKYDRILANGRTVNARVYDKVIGYKRTCETVYYFFVAPDGKEYKGKLTTSRGVHRLQDLIEVHYLPGNPKQNTAKGTLNSNWVLLLMIVIALVVAYMAYRLHGDLTRGGF
jgi:hypothetical protein